MIDLDRRRFLRLAAASGAVLTAESTLPFRLAPARAQAALRVTHFGGPYGVLKDLVGAPFEQEKLAVAAARPWPRRSLTRRNGPAG